MMINHKKRISLNFVWFDMWIGFFVNTDKKKIYFCLLPCIVFSFNYN